MKNLKYIFILTGFVFFSQTIYAQWGFTVSQGQRGNCVGCGNIQINVIDFGTIPINGFPTRQTCESVRQSLIGISQTFDCGCTLFVICTECAGMDITTPGQGNSTNSATGSINFNGTGQGQAFANTNNPMQNINNWMDEWQLRYQKLYDWKNSQGYHDLYDWDKNPYVLPFTANKDFDKNYTQIVENVSKANNIIGQDGEAIAENSDNSTSDEQWLQAVESGQQFIPATNSTGNAIELDDGIHTKVNTQQDEPKDYDAYYENVIEPKYQYLYKSNVEDVKNEESIFSIKNLPVSDETKDILGKTVDLTSAVGGEGLSYLGDKLSDAVGEDIKNNISDFISVTAKNGKNLAETVKNAFDVSNDLHNLTTDLFENIEKGTIAGINGKNSTANAYLNRGTANTVVSANEMYLKNGLGINTDANKLYKRGDNVREGVSLAEKIRENYEQRQENRNENKK